MSQLLTPKQVKAIQAMLETVVKKDVAAAAGVSVRTLERWMVNPFFREALAEAESDAISGATRQLIKLQSSAIDTISGVLSDKTLPVNVRLQAGAVVLKNLLKLRELQTIEKQLVDLEKMAHEINTNSN